MKLLTNHSPVLTAGEQFQRARGFKYKNIFQIAKQVRRACRLGRECNRVILRQTGSTPESDPRKRQMILAIAHTGKRRAESALRVACYYLSNHNVDDSQVAAALKNIQSV